MDLPSFVRGAITAFLKNLKSMKLPLKNIIEGRDLQVTTLGCQGETLDAYILIKD